MPFGAVLLLSACEALPCDPENTAKTVAQAKQFEVGIVAGTGQQTHIQQLLDEISRGTHARPRVSSGSAEELLQRVSEGNLDLVVGAFTKDSPWTTQVAFGPPLRSSGPKDNRVELKAAMRNGENRWIMLVERASRTISPEARSQ
jgi:hypothetical protein